MLQKRKDIFNVPNLSVPLDGSTALSAGALVYRDTTNGVVKAATSAAGTTVNIFGVVVGAVASGATSVEVMPILGGPGQLWLADCTNNTAANQLLKPQGMTNSLTIANTSTATATNLGIFIPVLAVGAASDKKLLGYFVASHQVTA